jgi:uncharacterized membrane protein
MDPVAAITFWAALFIATHLFISSGGIRPRLVGLIGDQAYRGVYSLVAFATLIPLTIVFARNKHAGVMLWNLRGVGVVRGLTWLLMLVALIFFVASFVNPNPGSIGAPASTAGPRGILKITRHPNFVAIILFGFAHILMNGWAGDVIFFGTFPVLGIVGGLHQDRRKIREVGESYVRFVAETSFVPGAAILSGRQRWSGEDMPWAAIGIGALATALLVGVHPYIFGGQPMG